MPWVYDVHSGGTKIPSQNYEKIRKQVQAYEAKRSWKNDCKSQVRFRGQFCYVDALQPVQNLLNRQSLAIRFA
jgi:hypothetical protein